MSCKGEVALRLEEVLLLLPSNLFNEIFHDCNGPFPQVLFLLCHILLVLLNVKDVYLSNLYIIDRGIEEVATRIGSQGYGTRRTTVP